MIRQEKFAEAQQGERQSERLGTSRPANVRPKLVDCIPDFDIVGKVVGSEFPVSMMQDHASSAKLTVTMFDEICAAEATLRNLEYEGTDVAYCGDHKRSNTIKAATAAQQKHLTTLLPVMKDPTEWGEVISMLYRQLANQFSGRGNPYEFGRGVDKYPVYMAERHPGELRTRASAVGQHYDMNPESALTSIYTWNNDLEYLLYLSQVKKDGLN